MKKYQFKVIPKSPLTEVNIARLLQPVDFNSNKVEMEEYKPAVEEKKIEGPQKSSVSVSSRKLKKEEKISEYNLRCSNNEKTKTWLGKSEESGKYAILVYDGNEVKLVLADHWFKFSPVFQGVRVEQEKELKIGIGKRQKEEAELVKEVLGEDSDEEKPKKKARVPNKRDDDDSGKEGIDFNDEFTDDEEVVDDDDKEKSEEAAIKHGLSNSGKQIQKLILNEKSNSYEESGESSDMGLSDEDSDKEGINKQAVINELIRLGRTKLGDLISECRKKFKTESGMMGILTGIIREVADISGNGENADVILKEEYKRNMPSFGVRVIFQTKK